MVAAPTRTGPSWVISVEPTSEPVTRDEAKLHARVMSDVENSYIDDCIVAARQYVENYTHRQLVTATWVMRLDGFPSYYGQAIDLPRPPLISVGSITYLDENGNSQTWSASKYQVDTKMELGQVMPIEGESYPSTQAETFNTVTVTYDAGYGAASVVPQGIKAAIRMLVTHWFERRDPISTTAGANIAEIPLMVLDLLNQYRVWRV